MKDISIPKNEIWEPFKFAICKVIDKIKSTVSSSTDKPMQILQNNIMNLPAESIPRFLSKKLIHERISLMKSSLNVQEPRELHQFNLPEHSKNYNFKSAIFD
ncbi:hypothetical protein HZS_7577 [Henneguya salminicola]|nr:hypothetical protein HZS_7577 [Henneguya salminicola]